MSVAVPFDTLEYVRRLQEAGIAAPQAEAQARALADALTGRVVFRDDLDAVEARLISRLDSLDNRLSGRIDALDGRIDGLGGSLGGRIDKLAGSVDTIKWLFGLLAALNIATFAKVVLGP